MATATKNKSTAKQKTAIQTADYAHDPFFVKKREMASVLLKKAGLPGSFAKKK